MKKIKELLESMRKKGLMFFSDWLSFVMLCVIIYALFLREIL